MKPVDQQANDDCVRACAASLLELPLEEVPHFVAIGGSSWRFHFIQWLAQRGFGFLEIPFERLGRDSIAWYGGHYIVSGTSPRQPGGPMQHAVVFKDYSLAHDPHPSRAGLIGEPKLAFFLVKA